MNDDESMVMQRFVMLNLVRLSATALTVVGLLIVAGKIAVPKPAGIAFTVFGLLELFLLPPFLARKWKSPDS